MWFAYALLSAMFTGCQAFLNKVSAEEGHDSYYISAVAAIATTVIAYIAFLFSSASLSSITGMLFFLGVMSAILYTGRTVTQLESLRFIDSAIFFPLYKVIGPLLVTGIAMLFLGDHLSTSEIVGIFLSCLVPLLLITRSEHLRQKNLTLGLTLMVASTALAAITASVNALAVKPGEDLTRPFMLIAYSMSILVACPLYFHAHRKLPFVETLKRHSTKRALFVGSAIGVFQFISFYFLLLAFSGSNVSVAYSISAHYILIPVILSVWFYKEHWNIQKAIALIVSMLALILLHN